MEGMANYLFLTYPVRSILMFPRCGKMLALLASLTKISVAERLKYSEARDADNTPFSQEEQKETKNRE